ncbi:MAG TPA: tRNA (guanosine(46)-N7)-methyltransferase TrmB, partial [Clostridiales bacterium]|nr:tRNA (guanosine(46)-N7)-methyltransferase TrmB [Clostridiales bacterium]
MRMRKKKNGAARMELCRELLVEAPENNKGNWNAYFQNDHSLHLEIGCGKGGFITTLAAMNPAINYVAIERY